MTLQERVSINGTCNITYLVPRMHVHAHVTTFRTFTFTEGNIMFLVCGENFEKTKYYVCGTAESIRKNGISH